MGEPVDIVTMCRERSSRKIGAYKTPTMKLKTHCIKCDNEIGGNLEENYEKRGNYCISCDNRADTNKKSVRGRLIKTYQRKK